MRIRSFFGNIGSILVQQTGPIGFVLGALVCFVVARIGNLPSDLAKYQEWQWGVLALVVICAVAIGLVFGTIGYLLKWKTLASKHTRAAKLYVAALEKNAHQIGGIVAAAIEKLESHGSLYATPSDYAAFIRRIECDVLAPKNNYCDNILLVGSMVGFAFILPRAIRNFACSNGTRFQRLRILGTDREDKQKPWFWFSVYLAARLVHELLFSTCTKVQNLIVQDGHRFEMIIAYTHHDLPMAAIDMPNASVAVLQAFSPDSFKQLIPSGTKRRMLGFRFDNRPEETDEYSRYHEALEDHWLQLADAKRQEKWVLSRSIAGRIELEITRPHWLMDQKNHASLEGMSKEAFSTAITAPATSMRIQQSDLREFIDNLQKAIPSRNADIQMISNVISDEGKTFNEALNTACGCGTG